jgi:hypothetical protein
VSGRIISIILRECSWLRSVVYGRFAGMNRGLTDIPCVGGQWGIESITYISTMLKAFSLASCDLDHALVSLDTCIPKSPPCPFPFRLQFQRDSRLQSPKDLTPNKLIYPPQWRRWTMIRTIECKTEPSKIWMMINELDVIVRT